ncbi:SulP family inorganic anion transporter [Thorsellia kenyensis]|uniref:SulP family inorganic anion transporter n=1 Tax=Thorsellia kenyensis TaxID=1549888 RepID=A0ABV6C6K7_9GAMM
MPDTLAVFLIPDVLFNLTRIQIILPYSHALAIVGLLESLMRATILDDLTKANSNKNRESIGQGMANVGTSFLGGMAGCAMIGQSIFEPMVSAYTHDCIDCCHDYGLYFSFFMEILI